MTRDSDRKRAADARRAAEPDAATGLTLPNVEHDHPGGRGACTPGCPANMPADNRRRAVQPERRTMGGRP